MSLTDGLWMAAWMKSQNNAQSANDRARNLEESLFKLADVVGQTNDQLVVSRAERDSYKNLSTEMVHEIKGYKPVRLSAPNADEERIAYLKQQYRMSAAKHMADVEAQYKNSDPELADQARNNSARQAAQQRKSKMR
ncbi:hypothetical protein [Aquabacterium sp.]|uniref:hypothetical protein n=1 Tax=Aquabacterium sp. TaxID=1872578 RepID=UPI0026216D06|nr:hypothetical protein [Aquabacterium sp.]MDD2976885.1 hypothetical protein [Aquabacterium sp.]